jgi:hypothetical protein
VAPLSGGWEVGRENRWPATRAISATRAIAAMAQGREDEKLRGSAAAVVAAPTAVPQRWQYLAPGLSEAPHAAHGAEATLAPHDEQNLPVASAPQFGHLLVGSFCEAGTAMR